MAKNKTTDTGVPVDDFLDAFVDNEQKKADSHRLVELMSAWSGFPARMWGPSIIGFGNYHYVYASGHEGDAPMLGFSPRKAQISLYVFTGLEAHKHLLEDLGKFTMGKACIYTKKLDDIHLPTLEKLCKATIAHLEKHYECS